MLYLCSVRLLAHSGCKIQPQPNAIKIAHCVAFWPAQRAQLQHLSTSHSTRLHVALALRGELAARIQRRRSIAASHVTTANCEIVSSPKKEGIWFNFCIFARRITFNLPDCARWKREGGREGEGTVGQKLIRLMRIVYLVLVVLFNRHTMCALCRHSNKRFKLLHGLWTPAAGSCICE